jgi:hypothetical protein
MRRLTLNAPADVVPMFCIVTVTVPVWPADWDPVVTASTTRSRVNDPTFTCAVPVIVPFNAIAFAVPALIAVKSPLESMVPTVSLSLDHVKRTSVRSLPLWSFAVAVNCRVSPAESEAVEGVMDMEFRVGVEEKENFVMKVS